MWLCLFSSILYLYVSTSRYAVVTGANRGIGLEICRQLAANGVIVVLTARNKKRGLEAVESLKGSGLSNVLFHQLDVSDPASIASLADFIRTQFGKLDILVNNAGIIGTLVTDPDGFRAGIPAARAKKEVNWKEIMIEPLELAEECLKINYYGPKRMSETFVPLLELSDSARIVNVSSSMGRLQNIKHEWAKGVLSDVENLREEMVDKVLNEFVKDFKEGSLEAKSWPTFLSANTVSKAALNAYTRILADKYLNFCINCVCPGFVKTDINYNTGILTVEEGAESPVRLALLPHGGPSGLFFIQKDVCEF